MIGLRDVHAADSSLLRRWRNTPDVARYMYTDHVIEGEEHSRWFAEAMADPSRRYWIITVDEAPVGLANLYDIDAPNLRAKFALYVAESQARGSGAGSRALYSMVQYAFRDLGLHKLGCEALASNTAALSLYQKFGFRVDGVLRNEIRRGDGFVDVSILSMLADEWSDVASEIHAGLVARGLI